MPNVMINWLRAIPDLGVEIVSLYFKKNAFMWNYYLKYLSQEADTTIKRRMTKNFSRCILRQILVLERILFVISQHNSSIDNNMNMLTIIVEYQIPLLFFYDFKMVKYIFELYGSDSLFFQPTKQGLLSYKHYGLLNFNPFFVEKMD